MWHCNIQYKLVTQESEKNVLFFFYKMLIFFLHVYTKKYKERNSIISFLFKTKQEKL